MTQRQPKLGSELFIVQNGEVDWTIRSQIAFAP